MKLELKHIAPYLPYGLKTNEGKLIGLTNWIGWCGTFKDNTGETRVPLSAVKPLLLPLSALTEPLEDGTVPIVELAKIHLDWVEGNDYDLKCDYRFSRQVNVISTWQHKGCTDSFYNDNLFIQTIRTHLNPYWINEYLFANHFDVFGLIEQGLAIDKRTIKPINHD